MSICFVALFGMFGFTQTLEEKVKDYLGDERYDKAQTSNPGLISFLEMKAEEGYRLTESIEEKKDSYIKVDRVLFKKEDVSIEFLLEALNQENFNLLHYTFPNQDSNVTSHYLLGDSGMLMTVYSNAVINNKVASSL